MKIINPKIDYLCVDCPIYNSEWFICNITKKKCPKIIENDNEETRTYFPDDCPSKKGVIVKLEINNPDNEF